MINNTKIYKHLYAAYGSLYSENNYFDVTVQFSRSVMSDFLRTNHSMPGLPIHHQLLESTQTHVHWVDDNKIIQNRKVMNVNL